MKEGSYSAASSVRFFLSFPSGCLRRVGSGWRENAQDAQLPPKADQGGAEPQAPGPVYPHLYIRIRLHPVVLGHLGGPKEQRPPLRLVS